MEQLNNGTIINNKGITLIITILIMSLLLFLGIYFLSLTITESKISKSHANAMQSYYLAEAGIQEMVFRLKNNEAYRDNFTGNASWSQTFITNNPFYGNSSYEVTIQNSDYAHGDITSTGLISLTNDTSTQRIIEMSVYKAMGEGGGTNWRDNSLLVDEQAYFTASRPYIYNGNLHSNNYVTAWLITELYVENNLTAVNNINKYTWSDIIVDGDIRAANYPPAAEYVALPAVSFDDPTDPDSFKNRADIVYTEAEFANLINNNTTLTLNNAITYVTGDINMPKEKNLQINNGVLVADGSITLGTGSSFWCMLGFGNSFKLNITNTLGEPSGLIAKGNIEFNYCMDEVNLDGIIYANNEVVILGNKNGFNFNGGIIARGMGIFSIWSPVRITLNLDLITPALSTLPEFSPIISVEHWEEEY